MHWGAHQHWEVKEKVQLQKSKVFKKKEMSINLAFSTLNHWFIHTQLRFVHFVHESSKFRASMMPLMLYF